MKDSLTNFSQERRLMMSPGQDESIHTYTYPNTRRLAREGYGGKVGASFRDFASSANTSILIVIRFNLNTKTDDKRNLMQEHKTYEDDFEKLFEVEYDELKRADEDCRLSNTEGKEVYKTINSLF